MNPEAKLNLFFKIPRLNLIHKILHFVPVWMYIRPLFKKNNLFFSKMFRSNIDGLFQKHSWPWPCEKGFLLYQWASELLYQMYYLFKQMYMVCFKLFVESIILIEAPAREFDTIFLKYRNVYVNILVILKNIF